ncbi:hypothetical protein F4694_000586 [Bacillus niacini]|uniref:Right handed beta helix domain-containing protein n=1 Tax=Neobacillus niacini TaxID=86668 RepID=A0A852T7U1_9BACI|nr:right-handed parallel beta-helix repeat-containing protein [Neobacillus niacini]NYE03867.1 hypothetical protein [Neobacillus niacini]
MTYVIQLANWGIHNDGTHPKETTNGINNALIWAANEGFNTVVIPNGTYLIYGIGTNPNVICKNGIHVPSNMHLKLSGNTVLKIEPNGGFTYSVISVGNKENVKISGGKIAGDRNNHVYYLTQNMESGGIDNNGKPIADSTKIRTVGYFDQASQSDKFPVPRYYAEKSGITTTTFDAFYYDINNVYLGKQTSLAFNTGILSGYPAGTKKIKIVVNQPDPTHASIKIKNGLWMEDDFGYGIDIKYSKNVRIDNVELYDLTGDGLYVGVDGVTNGNPPSDNVVVNNCKIYNCRRQGISAVGVINSIIKKCEIYGTNGVSPQYGIDVESAKNENVTIAECYVHDNVGGGIHFYSGNHTTCFNNRVENNNLSVGYTDYCKIQNNTLISSSIVPIWLTDGGDPIDLIIQGNVVIDGNISIPNITRPSLIGNKIIRGQISFSGTRQGYSANNDIVADTASIDYGFKIFNNAVVHSVGDNIIGEFTNASVYSTGNSTSTVVFDNLSIKSHRQAIKTSGNETIFNNLFVDKEFVINTNTDEASLVGRVLFNGGVIKNLTKTWKAIGSTTNVRYTNVKIITSINVIYLWGSNAKMDVMDNIIEIPENHTSDIIRLDAASSGLLIGNKLIKKAGTTGKGIVTANSSALSKIWNNYLIGCTINNKTTDDVRNNIVF